MLIIVAIVVVILFIAFMMLPLFFNNQDQEDQFFREMFDDVELRALDLVIELQHDLDHPFWEFEEETPLHERETLRKEIKRRFMRDIRKRRKQWRKQKLNRPTIPLQ